MENPFEALTRQLLNKNPRLLPLLYQPSSVIAGRSLSEPRGRLNRKRDALHPDVEQLGLGLGLAIGTVHT